MSADEPPFISDRLRSAALHVQRGELEGYVLVLPDLLIDAADLIERLRREADSG